jgi:metal-dependent amidase/aminoacylase/carboxypeptidase family protein
VRTYKEETRQHVFKSIERICRGMAVAAGVPEERMPVVTMKDEFTPAAYNTPELVERTAKVLRGVVGEENVVPREPSMGGEDFGRYGREEPKIPIFMFRLGAVAPERVRAAKEGKLELPSLHSSKFLPQPECLKTGVLTLTAAAIDLLSE